jgi:uncharacterized protein YhdP
VTDRAHRPDAALTRADARAVWRYLPAAINADARHWVRDALKEGTASEAKLILKGDLANFPFLDRKQGQFLVTVKAQDVTLDYGTGWPVISGIDADLRFEGNGMVELQRGSILGARLSQTRAEIPDFDAPVSTLKVKGTPRAIRRSSSSSSKRARSRRRSTTSPRTCAPAARAPRHRAADSS